MSVGVVNKSTGDRIQTAGDPRALTFDDVPTNGSTNPVKSDGIYDALVTKANQSQIATVEASTTASKAYSANEYLVLGGVLYKVTANIAQGGTIVTEGAGKNVDLATVGGELSAINSNLANKLDNKGSYSLTGGADDTYKTLLNALCSGMEHTKIRAISKLVLGSDVFTIMSTTANAEVFSRVVSVDNVNIRTVRLTPTGSYYFFNLVDTNGFTSDNRSETSATGVVATVIY